MKTVLLAIGDDKFSNILEKYLQESFHVLTHRVYHHRYLRDMVKEYRPDILIAHDTLLERDESDEKNESELEYEWLDHVEYFRREYEDSIRFVFICERSKGDPFLSELVNRNVYDIFYTRKVDIVGMIEQLLDRPRYSRVAHLKFNSDVYNRVFGDGVEPEENREEEENANEKSVEDLDQTKSLEIKEQSRFSLPFKRKEITQGTVKPQKIIKKEVTRVKREFHFQIQRQKEKVVGVPVPSKMIMVGSPFSRTGSTLIAHLLTDLIAQEQVGVSYVENPYRRAYMYDRLAAHQHVRSYVSFYHSFAQRDISQKQSADQPSFETNEFRQGFVQWVIKNPEWEPRYSETEIDVDVFLKLILSLKHTPIIVLDVGPDWYYDSYRYLFDVCDHAYVVMEPDVANGQYILESKKQNHVYLRKILENEHVNWVANRFSDAMLKQDVFRDLFGQAISVPVFPPEDTFKAQVDGSSLLSQRKSKTLAEQSLGSLIADILPDDFIKRKKSLNPLRWVKQHSIKMTKTQGVNAVGDTDQ